MHALWLYLKDNVKCGGKLSEVLGRPERCRNKHNSTSAESNLVLDYQLAHPIATPIRELIHRQNYSRTRLYELEIGDASRKVVEIIFRKALMGPSRSTRRIKSVIKVQNSMQTLERFENYREKVKTAADSRCMKHARCTVDGNELLRFYGTTMACRREKSKRVVSELCKNPTCRVCRILQSNFRIECTLNNGIQMSSSSEDFSEVAIPITKMKNMERAVIVCRTIAGSMRSSNEEYNAYDSIRREKGYDNSRNVTVWDPSALLPCFVIVFT
ncbi:Poly(ADP-ribose) polymerase, catalytic domain containing protein [Trema orientale]|uniref:Poly(ADP-ribose) polymerase, catalytic domain containing protein n=1 Tax=Trema orientale TaxID=63057 RepID=A0A2P5F8K6_TREOI|nr:Poly(ADP-ribose) polymerase, catalytic domain containing protein [Trema orientale]